MEATPFVQALAFHGVALLKEVAVETALSSLGSGCPPHRSQRAQLAHWALPLGGGEEALLGPGVRDADGGQVVADQRLHFRPA